MKWYDASKFIPKWGSRVFVWDIQSQKQIMVNMYCSVEEFKSNYDPNFPVWSYVLEDLEPFEIEK